MNGRLIRDDFDIILVPGGFADNYMEALGGDDGKGAVEIKEFVRQGGSYVGICAGSNCVLQKENVFEMWRL